MVSAPRSASLDEPECFQAFYEDALTRVYSYLLARCGGQSAIAEDLTQETFLAAVREFQRGRAVVTPLPWVLGIARHKLFDYYRAEAKRAPIAAFWNDERMDALPEPEHLEGAARERVQRVLMRIPVVQRQALVLWYMDGYSVPEVARQLGRSVHAAESLLARGRASFRRGYGQMGDADE